MAGMRSLSLARTAALLNLMLGGESGNVKSEHEIDTFLLEERIAPSVASPVDEAALTHLVHGQALERRKEGAFAAETVRLVVSGRIALVGIQQHRRSEPVRGGRAPGRSTGVVEGDGGEQRALGPGVAPAGGLVRRDGPARAVHRAVLPEVQAFGVAGSSRSHRWSKMTVAARAHTARISPQSCQRVSRLLYSDRFVPSRS